MHRLLTEQEFIEEDPRESLRRLLLEQGNVHCLQNVFHLDECLLFTGDVELGGRLRAGLPVGPGLVGGADRRLLAERRERGGDEDRNGSFRVGDVRVEVGGLHRDDLQDLVLNFRLRRFLCDEIMFK